MENVLFFTAKKETIFSISNIKAYFNLKKTIKESKYEFIYCDTFMSGLIARLAVRKYKKVKIIYTSYGFPFYKGSPLRKWLIYYSIEKYLSKYTYKTITLNYEDYKIAKRKFKNSKVYLLNGIDLIDEKRSMELDENTKNQYYKEFNLNKDDYIFLNIGELNNNKNQIMQLAAMVRLKEYKNAKLLIAGKGPLEHHYEQIIQKCNLTNNVRLIGNRNDTKKLLQFCNCLISTSKIEGLPLNIIEAILEKKPVIATKVRGQIDLLPQENLVDLCNVDELCEKMEKYIVTNKRHFRDGS
jgi:glycosyltransferase EpsD